MRILLATDAASGKGINLQAHCRPAAALGDPVEPEPLEQRNGRIDRHGQHAPEVDVFHFGPGPGSRRTPPRRTAARWKTSSISSTWP